MAPAWGRSSPRVARRRVVLPEPVGPTTAANSPGGTVRLTPANTGPRSYPQTTWSNSTAGEWVTAIVPSGQIGRIDALEGVGLPTERCHHRPHVLQQHPDVGVLGGPGLSRQIIVPEGGDVLDLGLAADLVEDLAREDLGA